MFREKKEPRTEAGNELDAFLSSQEPVIVVPYLLFLTNPDKAILKCPDVASFKSIIEKQSKYFVVIYVTKKSIGDGRFNYIAWNQHFAYSFDI